MRHTQVLCALIYLFNSVAFAGLPTKFFCVAKNSLDRRGSKLVPVRMNIHLELECLGPGGDKEDQCFNLNTKRACKGKIRQNRLGITDDDEVVGFRELIYKKVKTVNGRDIFKLQKNNGKAFGNPTLKILECLSF